MKERIHLLTKYAIRNSKINIHNIINLRSLNVCDKNCFLFVLKATSVLKGLSALKVGVFLTPYQDEIIKEWNLEMRRIQMERSFFNGKTRYEYENGL